MSREVVEVVSIATLDDVPDGSTYKKLSSTEQTKLTGIAEGADVNLTALATQTAIVALSDTDRVLIGSEPQSGEKKIYGIHRNAAGNLETDQEDTPV